MKIIEALKNLKTIQKRIEKNCQQINEYCAYVSTETPAFETAEKQEAQVQSLIQSNLDLELEYLRLKRAIDNTNLFTNATIVTPTRTYTYPISELITIRRTAGQFRTRTYQSLNSGRAISRLQTYFNQKGGVDPANPAKVVSLYKEEEKNAALLEWESLLSQIDATLEVVNATTDLIGY